MCDETVNWISRKQQQSAEIEVRNLVRGGKHSIGAFRKAEQLHCRIVRWE